MNDFEKKIEKAALIFDKNVSIKSPYIGFIRGAKSSESKEYWQQEMYTEEEVLKLLEDHRRFLYTEGIQHTTTFDWFKENKKNI